MLPDGRLVVFKSTPQFYGRERDGRKPNTIRLLDRREYIERLDPLLADVIAGKPATISIMGTANDQPPFFRRITDISQVGELVGLTLWCISWDHELDWGVGYTGTFRDDGDEIT